VFIEAAEGRVSVGARGQHGARARRSGKTNGELLQLADGQIDVFVTIDAGMEYQQRLEGRSFGVVVLSAASNRLEALLPLVPRLVAELDGMMAGQVVRVGEVYWRHRHAASAGRVATHVATGGDFLLWQGAVADRVYAS
jgi:hypothetical protein